jgi:hypothetical protein
MTVVARNPSKCRRRLSGPWDFYDDAGDASPFATADSIGTPYIPLDASIYAVAFADIGSHGVDSYTTPLTDQKWFVTIPNSDKGAFFQHKQVYQSICPGAANGELVYLRLLDSEIGYTLKTFIGEAVDDLGHSTHIAIAYQAGAGNPAGCFEITTTTSIGGFNEYETARPSATYTWEDLGVPSSSHVIRVDLASFQRKIVDVPANISGHTFTVRVLDADDNVLVEGTATLATVADADFITVPLQVAGGLIGFPYLDSDTDAKVQLEYALNVSAGATAGKVQIDNVKIIIYHTGGGMDGIAQINAATKEWKFVVTNADWESSDWPAMVMPELVPVGYYVVPEPFPFGNLYSNSYYFASVFGVGHSSDKTGLRRWETLGGGDLFDLDFTALDNADHILDASETYAVPHWQEWRIGASSGNFIYDFLQPLRAWLVDNPTHAHFSPDPFYDGVDQYFYTWPFDSINTLEPYNADDYPYCDFGAVTPVEIGGSEIEAGYVWPAIQALQSDIAIGVSYPHMAGTIGLKSGESYEASFVLHIGKITFDTYGFPTVGGEEVTFGPWSFQVTGYLYEPDDWVPPGADPNCPDRPYLNSPGLAYNPAVYVVAFDAIGGSSITIISYSYYEDFDSYFQAGDDPPEAPDITTFAARTSVLKTALIVNTTVVDTQPVRTITGVGDPPPGDCSTTEDETAFYPRWRNPRALQPTQAEWTDSGGTRSIVFARIPFDQDEADSLFGGAMERKADTLRCYNGDSLEYTIRSRWAYEHQATGTVTLDSGATLTNFNAVPGSDADGTVANGTVTVDVDQIATPGAEDCLYDGPSNTLTCKIDIAGGHDTVDFLAQLINDSSDFTCDVGSHGEYSITGSTSGSGTLSGGTDVSKLYYGTDFSSYWPFVHTSSDRFYYVWAFPMKVKVEKETNIPNRNRKYVKYASEDIKGSYPLQWQISHDGSIRNAVFVGEKSYARAGGSGGTTQFIVTWQPVGNRVLDCVKNSSSVDLAPEKEDL